MPALNVLLNHLAHINDCDESHTKKSTSNPLLRFKRHVQKTKEKTELVAMCKFPSSIISACHGNDKEWDFQMPEAEDGQQAGGASVSTPSGLEEMRTEKCLQALSKQKMLKS